MDWFYWFVHHVLFLLDIGSYFWRKYLSHNPLEPSISWKLPMDFYPAGSIFYHQDSEGLVQKLVQTRCGYPIPLWVRSIPWRRQPPKSPDYDWWRILEICSNFRIDHSCLNTHQNPFTPWRDTAWNINPFAVKSNGSQSPRYPGDASVSADLVGPQWCPMMPNESTESKIPQQLKWI